MKTYWICGCLSRTHYPMLMGFEALFDTLFIFQASRIFQICVKQSGTYHCHTIPVSTALRKNEIEG